MRKNSPGGKHFVDEDSGYLGFLLLGGGGVWRGVCGVVGCCSGCWQVDPWDVQWCTLR